MPFTSRNVRTAVLCLVFQIGAIGHETLDELGILGGLEQDGECEQGLHGNLRAEVYGIFDAC